MLMTPGSGIVTVNRIMAALSEAKTPLRAVIGQSPSVLRKGLSTGLEWMIEPLSRCESGTLDRANTLYDRVHSTGGQWVAFGQDDYPPLLREGLDYQAPPLLTIYGDPDLLSMPAVAVVGSRDPSEHGITLAKELARWCHDCDRAVISGGAQGIDITAHEGSNDCGGRTLFVVPEGVLQFKGPRWLNDALEHGRAAVISQSIPDTPWSTSAALTRNQTIAAMASLVTVIDPGESGGSFRAANHAIEIGRRTLVYAYDKLNSGYAALIRQGSYPVLNESGEWDIDYLEQHWVQGGQSGGKQVDLF